MSKTRLAIDHVMTITCRNTKVRGGRSRTKKSQSLQLPLSTMRSTDMQGVRGAGFNILMVSRQLAEQVPSSGECHHIAHGPVVIQTSTRYSSAIDNIA